MGADAVAAIDPSPPFVEACRARHPGVDVRIGVAEQLPFASTEFDATLACLVVGFMSDARAGVQEMSRVTRPGGVVAACFWDVAQMPAIQSAARASGSSEIPATPSCWRAARGARWASSDHAAIWDTMARGSNVPTPGEDILVSNLVTERSSAVGRVSGLWRYPVKSMAAESLAGEQLSWAGVSGDRRWAFVRPGAERNGFPWHTIREQPLLCRYIARLVDPARPDKSDIAVQTPAGDTFSVHDPGLAAELGSGVRVMRMDRGIFDAMPISLITERTVSALCALAHVTDDNRRFRPNLVIASTVGRPFAEDEWVGSVLHIGEAIVRVDARDSRCVVVNVDPDSGRVDASLLKVIGGLRQAKTGVYGTVVQPGLVQIGDEVRVGD